MFTSSSTLILISVWFVATGEALSRNRNHRRPVLSPVTSSRDRRPNIVLILTDDQDVELGSLNFMPKTLRAVRDKGAEFRHAYVTTPMCCPSRSSLLTGMYVHNHNVYTNNDNCSSAQWQATHETRSYATYLSNAGYRTGYFGKYLNKYNGSYIPPGWREWGGLIMNSKYYNYSINMNGKKIKHGFDYNKDYYSDLIANDSVAFLRQSKRNSAHKPVMLTMSFPAPHGPEDSAPQYSHLFFNVTTHHTPSYDYAPNLDKQWILQVTKKMQPIHRQFTDLLMTKRLQTLQSVDSAVERVINELEALGELRNTYVIYTSDHGYHLGQFGLIKGKSFPFEFDVRVPFLVRGPGIEPGTVVDDIVLNIDLAPTFLDIAGVETPSQMDGHSALPLFLNVKRKRLKWPDTFLIESSGRREFPDNKHKQHLKPVVLNPTNTTDSTEDDYEEDDDDGEIPEEDEEKIDEEEEDEIEEGGQIQLFNQVPALSTHKSARLADCQNEEYRLPCREGQKWYCQQEEHGRWRKHKCKFAVPFKKTYKKCACFTPNGLVYRKVPVNITVPMHPAQDHRTKRDSRKRKRNTLDLMQTIRDELTGLRDDTNFLPGPGCALLESGKVNCSTLVFRNPKSWRQSRHFIDGEIQRLRHKLENLKEIRRHLKQSRPFIRQNVTEATYENATKSDTDEFFNATTTITHRRHHHRKHRFDNTTEAPQSVFNLTDLQPDESVNVTVTAVISKPKVLSNELNSSSNEYCHCEADDSHKSSELAARETRHRIKEERHRKRERRQRKKAKLEKECLSEKMNCFSHDGDHWRTPPLWTAAPFCFCMNANNNTYSCLRTINSTHNFLYCEFTTGEVSYYNLRIDPFELQNRYNQLKLEERFYLHEQLAKLMACRSKSCLVARSRVAEEAPPSHRYHKRRKFLDDGARETSTVIRKTNTESNSPASKTSGTIKLGGNF